MFYPALLVVVVRWCAHSGCYGGSILLHRLRAFLQ